MGFISEIGLEVTFNHTAEPQIPNAQLWLSNSKMNMYSSIGHVCVRVGAKTSLFFNSFSKLN